MHNRIQRQQVYEKVMDRIRDDIASGRFKAGDRIETVRGLAQRLDVGQSSVREAVRVLSHAGLLRVKHGGGIFIAEQLDKIEAFDSSKFLAEASTQSLRHLMELRLAVEPMAARLAAERATEEECKDIQRCWDDEQQNFKVYHEQSASEQRLSQEVDISFHMAIAHAAHNPYFLDVLERVRTQTQLSHGMMWRIPQLVESSLRFHPQITRSIITHDALHAESFMRAHLEDVLYYLTDALGEL